MPVQTPEDLVAEQWSQLISIVQAEMQNGGRLTTLKDVRKGAQLWTEQVPAAGIQLKRMVESDGDTAAHMVTADFQIIVAANSTITINGSTETPANLDAAMATLQTLISDGSGNGFGPVLRDKANYFLNNNAWKTRLTSIEYDWDVQPGETPQVWAFATITLRTWQRVAIR